MEEFTNSRTDRHFAFSESQNIKVTGDPDRIEQVIINLFTNAIKYSPVQSTITVNAKRDDSSAIISVKDEGIGIPKEQQEQVFDRFYQVTDKVSKTYPGLGMGLYISYQIIAQHGGRMWVESEKGNGATFFFTLPLVEADAH